jgi:hypothetical protein
MAPASTAATTDLRMMLIELTTVSLIVLRMPKPESGSLSIHSRLVDEMAADAM